MPLVRLRRIGADVASLIYAKVESLNPGGSGGLLVSGDYWCQFFFRRKKN